MSEHAVNYGTVRANLIHPPSRGGHPTLTFQMPAELARTWPDWATHVIVHATPDGCLRLEAIKAAEHRVTASAPDRRPPWEPREGTR